MKAFRFILLVLGVLICSFGCLGAANQIDEILKSSGAQVFPQVVGDEFFVRRAYLSVVGRIPTAKEYKAFMTQPDPQKRYKLVAGLAKTEGYVSHWSNFWQEMLRGKTRLNNVNYLSGEPYVQYMNEQIRKNTHYDSIVWSLLNSSGKYSEAPEVGYFYRDLGMPSDNFINTVRVFAGLDISCAQCHDDPFQSWTQRQFYEGAAYFSEVTLASKRDKEVRDKIKSLATEAREKQGEVANNRLNQFLTACATELKTVGGKSITMPKDAKDTKPNDKVEAHPLFGVASPASSDKRSEFSTWLIGTEEFGENIANRMWDFVFGTPLAPLRNIHAEGVSPLNKTVLAKLGKRVTALNYDLRAFSMELYNSDFFQRGSYAGDMNSYALQGPVFRRLSAEQMWDSMVTLYLGNPDYFRPYFSEKYRAIITVDFDTLTLDEATRKEEEYKKAKADEFKDAKKFRQYRMIRASEIMDFNSPEASLLAKFGRSQRELINASSREGSSVQVMAFMNGVFTDMATSKDAALIVESSKLADKRDATDYLFTSILSRRPSLAERTLFQDFSLADLTWALLNSIEFKFY